MWLMLNKDIYSLYNSISGCQIFFSGTLNIFPWFWMRHIPRKEWILPSLKWNISFSLNNVGSLSRIEKDSERYPRMIICMGKKLTVLTHILVVNFWFLSSCKNELSTSIKQRERSYHNTCNNFTFPSTEGSKHYAMALIEETWKAQI